MPCKPSRHCRRRSLAATTLRKSLCIRVANSSTPQTAVLTASPCSKSTVAACCAWRRMCEPAAKNRSEEHTSELQSQSNLVCRLLLEKKKHKNSSHSQANATTDS